jgi:uncharacterized protein (DUF362 family)
MRFDEERRHMLESLALLLGFGLAIENAQCEPKRSSAEASRSRVARARRPDVVDSATGAVRVDRLRELLGKAIASATGTGSPTAAFRRLFRATDVVGIKVNTLAGRGLSSHPELVLMLADWLKEAGVRPSNIIIWDRSDRELEAAGFTLNRRGDGVRCLGTNDDYDWTPREWGPGGSCFARLLVEQITALINVGMVKDHDLSGVSAGLKNFYGVVHNPNKYHDNGCSPYVAHLAAHPLIKDKLRLTVLDGLVAQCHGGPARSPRWSWPWGGVLVSTDPVAVDAVARQTIEERRRELALKSLAEDGREPKWLADAARLGLGEARLDRIQVVDV